MERPGRFLSERIGFFRSEKKTVKIGREANFLYVKLGGGMSPNMVVKDKL